MEKVGPLRKGTVVTCTVTEVNDGGIEVSLADGVKAFIRRADLARDRADQRPERFGVGDKVDAMVTSYDKASRKISLSIKAREISEEKEAVAQYGSSELGRLAGRHPGRGPEREAFGRRVRPGLPSKPLKMGRVGLPRALFRVCRPVLDSQLSPRH